MNLLEMIKVRNWPGLFGFCLFIGMMSAGYYYNLTFVQLGLVDFGNRILNLEPEAVAGDMALLALMTCFIAIGFGLWIQKHDWGRRFVQRLRLSFLVVLTQTVLTLVCPLIQNEEGFVIWLTGVSLTLGIGVPVLFSMTVDLIPVRMRGGAAALVTGIAYFAAEAFSREWTLEAFRRQSLLMLFAGTVGVGLLVFVRHPWLDALSRQHELRTFAQGRFVRYGRPDRRLLGLIVIMFAIYFDQDGFSSAAG